MWNLPSRALDVAEPREFSMCGLVAIEVDGGESSVWLCVVDETADEGGGSVMVDLC